MTGVSRSSVISYSAPRRLAAAKTVSGPGSARKGAAQNRAAAARVRTCFITGHYRRCAKMPQGQCGDLAKTNQWTYADRIVAETGMHRAQMSKQLPISVNGAVKGDVRTQFAALCYRVKRGKVQILLVTSRRSKRWIVPKGWPIDGATPARTALQEAWEEAGVTGKATGLSIGVYSYNKDVGDTANLACLAVLYPVEVKSLAKSYPERGQRRRRWVSRKKAARLVAEPELSRLLLDFTPRHKKLAA